MPEIVLAGGDVVRSVRSMEIDTTCITRQDFMDFFRDDDRLNLLTNDDRLEIFTQILAGSSDITKELLDGLLSDYSVGDIEVVER
jgi:hypothetical protein